MCGVFGTWRVENADSVVENGMERLSHRGPDGRGLASIGDATHGHVRLSLVDLSSASSQPFKRSGGVLSWVGEIWNWRDLRKRLQKEGERFTTQGDTEIVASALSKWGIEKTLRELDGMFSIAWTDRKGETFLIRDSVGRIPLYVIRRGESFFWSSERKGFSGRSGGAAVPLPAKTVLTLSTGKMRKWEGREPRGLDGSDPETILSLLREGTRKRMEADAPVCCLISGGLDSGLVLSLAAEDGREVVAFTAVMDPDSSDAVAARRTCKEMGIKLIEARVSRPTARDLMDTSLCVETASKVQVEISALCIPLAKRIRAEGFKACLSGEGADELFGGYGNSIIAGRLHGDDWWRNHRKFLLGKMSRGNFPRCNKAFMTGGVECRLPFMDDALIEALLPLGKGECPPDKGLLKLAAKGVVAEWMIKRNKETFQGGSGMDEAAAEVVSDPGRFYGSEIRKRYGRFIRD